MILRGLKESRLGTAISHLCHPDLKTPSVRTLLYNQFDQSIPLRQYALSFQQLFKLDRLKFPATLEKFHSISALRIFSPRKTFPVGSASVPCSWKVSRFGTSNVATTSSKPIASFPSTWMYFFTSRSRCFCSSSTRSFSRADGLTGLRDSVA
jgi:hypothetical protein